MWEKKKLQQGQHKTLHQSELALQVGYNGDYTMLLSKFKKWSTTYVFYTYATF